MSKLLDKIGITDPWAQMAIVGILRFLLFFTLPGIIIGFVLGRLF
jgi:hypothetical protein